MRTDRSAPEESTSITTGTSDRYRLPCSMAFIVASATAVLSLSRRCSERPSPFTTAATLSIARRSFPGSLDTFNFARTRQVPLRPFCSTRLGTVTILPLSEASPEVTLSSCSQTPPTKQLRRTYASCLAGEQRRRRPRSRAAQMGTRSVSDVSDAPVSWLCSPRAPPSEPAAADRSTSFRLRALYLPITNKSSKYFVYCIYWAASAVRLGGRGVRPGAPTHEVRCLGSPCMGHGNPHPDRA